MVGLAPVQWQEGRFGWIGREILVSRDLEQDVIFSIEVKWRQRPRGGDEDESLERPPRAGIRPDNAFDLGHQCVQKLTITVYVLDEAHHDTVAVGPDRETRVCNRRTSRPVHREIDAVD